MKEIKIKPDSENPRTIDKEALHKLGDSIGDFGDLAGLVCNKKTGQWVCGHQRTKALEKLYPGYKIVETKEVTINGEKEGEGEILTADDKKTGFKVRIVNKSIEWQKMANIIANDQRIQGQYELNKLSHILNSYESPMIKKYDLPELKFYSEDKTQENLRDNENIKDLDNLNKVITIKCNDQSYETVHKLLTDSEEINDLIENENLRIHY